MANLKGKVALVTGATRGIGKGIAIGLGEAGATVYVTGRSVNADSDSSLPGSLSETRSAVEQAGGICIPVQVDHNNTEQVANLFEQIKTEQHGQLDVLVNNVYAGVSALRKAYGKPFWESEPELWDHVNHVGLRSHYFASVLAARMMTQRRSGLICTISSWGSLYYLFGVAYGTGKTACDRLATDMALELKPHNVASVSLWPGIVGTENMLRFAAEMGTAKRGLETEQVEDNSAQNQTTSAIREGYNWETPLLTGRAIATLANDPALMRLSGRVLVVAELAQHYGLVDQAGMRPASLRSLRFIVPYLLPALRKFSQWIPDWQVPWCLIRWNALNSPRR